jgi:hypothetical protein
MEPVQSDEAFVSVTVRDEAMNDAFNYWFQSNQIQLDLLYRRRYPMILSRDEKEGALRHGLTQGSVDAFDVF